MFPDGWYWYGSSDAIISWRPRPDRPPSSGIFAVADRIMVLGRGCSPAASVVGKLYRLDGDGNRSAISAEDALSSDGGDLQHPFWTGPAAGRHKRRRPEAFWMQCLSRFKAGDSVSSGHQINDVLFRRRPVFCGGRWTHVRHRLFDREGRIRAVLDAASITRLARVQRRNMPPAACYWALLNDGRRRVEFPSPIRTSNPSRQRSLSTPEPLRHEGRLWILADGGRLTRRLRRNGRLERFEQTCLPGASCSL